MPSLHGSFLFLVSQQNIFHYPIYIIALSGIQFLIIEFLYPEDVEDIQEEKK
jgi:hypothetical protein